jgi:hypothetical protein
VVRALVVAGCLPLIAVPALAVARPLPAGLTFKLDKEQLFARRAGVAVVVDSGPFEKLGKVDLSDDGATVVARAIRCWSDEPDTMQEERFPLASIEASFENRAGMKAHLAKKYADAIAHFTIAAKDDPGASVYATNLLSAQSMAGKLDDADRTIATYARRNPAWFAWRFAVDSDLKALRGRPSTKLVATPGTARGSLQDKIAYSPLGLVAHEVLVGMVNGMPDGSSSWELSIVDVATGSELLSLPTESTCSLDMDAAMNGDDHPPPLDKTCPAQLAKDARAKRTITDALLADLGFNIVANGYFEVAGADNKDLVAPDGRRVEVGVGDHITIDGKPVELEWSPYDVGFVPHAIVIVHKGTKMMGCHDADGPYNYEIGVVPTR